MSSRTQKHNNRRPAIPDTAAAPSHARKRPFGREVHGNEALEHSPASKRSRIASARQQEIGESTTYTIKTGHFLTTQQITNILEALKKKLLG